MKFKITFTDVIDKVENEEHAYEILLNYLNECVGFRDVSAFDFKEVKE
jgi:hypothetical protein